MKLGSTFKAIGCILTPIWIALAIPLILAYFVFKVLIYLVSDASAVKSERNASSTARRFRWRSDTATERPFGVFRSRRNDPLARQMRRHTERLISEIGEALKHNQRIPSDKKTALDKQTRQMTEYTLLSLQKLERIHKRKGLVNEARRLELTRLERRLTAEIERALSRLEDALVSIITVDVAGGSAKIDRLVADLSDSNSRLRDIADAHDEIRSIRDMWAGELQ